MTVNIADRFIIFNSLFILSVSMLHIFLLALVLSSALGDDVLELTDSDFEDGVLEHDTVLVMFYAPW